MRFSTVALGVGDLERSLEFYTEGLGFAVDSRPQEDLVYLASGETRIALYPADKLAGYAGVTESRPGGAVLALNVDSRAQVDEIATRCLAHRGTDLLEPRPVNWGYAGTVSDPDGHVWELVCAD